MNDSRGLGELIALDDGETLSGLTLRFLRFASISRACVRFRRQPGGGRERELLRQGRNLGASPRWRATAEQPRTIAANTALWTSIPAATTFGRRRRSRVGSAGSAASPPAQLVDQYYNGARDPKDASPLQVRGGESFSGLDFRLSSEKVVEVRGQIAGIPPEAEPPQCSQPLLSRRAPPAQAGKPEATSALRECWAVPESGASGIQVTISSVEFGPSMRREWRCGTRPGVSLSIWRRSGGTLSR